MSVDDCCSIATTYPLTARQGHTWALFQDGLSAAEIARRIKKSRQYVHQTLHTAETKIARSLLDTAGRNGLEIRAVRPERGILLGYHPFLRKNVVITYTTRNGIRVWYWYENPADVKDERLLSEARAYLLDEADERAIKVTAEQRKLHPAKLARIIFRELLPEVRP